MSRDQTYLQDINTTLDLFKTNSDARSFEFLCAFNNQVLCLLEEEVQTSPRGALYDDSIRCLREAATLALRIQQPLLFGHACDLDSDLWRTDLTTEDESALFLIQISLSVANNETRLPTKPWETRRWSAGQNELALELYASLKRKLVTRTLQETYATILAWFKVVAHSQGQRRSEAYVGVLDAIDAALGLINRVASWQSGTADAYRNLAEAISPYAQALAESSVQTGRCHLCGGFGQAMADAILAARA
jgi:hypothetical protein